jgi:hypothetical protein
MQLSLMKRGPFCSMLAMVYPTSLRLRRQICSLQKQAVVCAETNAFRNCLHANCESDLVTYCENEKVPFKTFENFSEILGIMKDIVAGTISVKDVAAAGT